MMKSWPFSVASFAAVTEFRYCTSAIVARIMMSAMTTINSMSVHPPSDRRLRARATRECHMARLPIPVFRAVKRLAVGLGIDVIHVLPAPDPGVRRVLKGPLAPICRASQRIDGNPAQELFLAPSRVVRDQGAVNELLE